MSSQSSVEALRRPQSARHQYRLLALVAVLGLATTNLACGFFETISSTQAIPLATRTPWPTFTPAIAPTPVAVAVAAEAAIITPLPPPQSGDAQAAQPAPTSAASQLPTLASIPAIPSPPPGPETAPMEGSAAPVEGPGGWSFASLRSNAGEDGLVVYGDMINNTGTSQELDVVSGIFYDSQGQVIAADRDVEGEWPIEVVPPGGRVPFKLVVNGIQSAANFELGVEANPSGITPRQDFEFVDTSPSLEAGYYCLVGQLRNSGAALREYLLITATLYDSENNLVNFGTYVEPNIEYVGDDELLDFEVCVDSPNQDAARYELSAWGQ